MKIIINNTNKKVISTLLNKIKGKIVNCSNGEIIIFVKKKNYNFLFII